MIIYRFCVLLVIIIQIYSFSQNDDDCVIKINNDHSLQTLENFKYALFNGYWNCANTLVTFLQNKQLDVSSIIESEYNIIQRNFEKLKSNIKIKQNIQSISPSFQWAQSVNDIFINVKFSHKIDAPATLNVEPKHVNITEKNIYLEASDGKKLFVLDIELFNNIIPDNSTYSLGSVGRMTLQLKKSSTPNKWLQLLSKNHRKINNMHFWWEYHEKFIDELEEYDEFIKKLEKEKKMNQTISNTSSNNSSNNTMNNDTVIDKKTKTKPIKQESLIDIEIKKIDIEIKNKINELDELYKLKRKELNDKYKNDKDFLDDEYQIKKKEIENNGIEKKKNLSSINDMEL